MSTAPAAVERIRVVKEELWKLPAFVRRDLLVLWSYRTAFVSDWMNLVLQVSLFWLMSRMIDPSTIPEFGGNPTSYIEFVAVGVAFSSFVQMTLSRVVIVMRNEQLQGTLESMLVTPTAPTTIQIGSVAYDLVYLPIRTAVFLVLMAVLLGASFDPSGLLPTIVILLAFIPFAWGLGVIGAAAVLTLRRGSGVVGLAGPAFTVLSGAYVPLSVFPAWLRTIAELNPLTLALDGARQALLAGAGWSVVWRPVAVLVPLSAATLALGTFAFRGAMRRERARGTLGLY